MDRHKIKILDSYNGNDVKSIMLDRHKITQVLVNVISNAKYALLNNDEDNRMLEISTKEVDNYLCISFKDNGEGLAEENLTRIFQHGFTTKDDGNGFGLHSCANIIKGMKGEILVKSEGLGKGAEFIIKIPY